MIARLQHWRAYTRPHLADKETRALLRSQATGQPCGTELDEGGLLVAYPDGRVVIRRPDGSVEPRRSSRAVAAAARAAATNDMPAVMVVDGRAVAVLADGSTRSLKRD